MAQKQPRIAIVLSGGGARAAYQVGVLKAIYEQIPPGSKNPFKIICGTSAGAINATVLACYAGQYRIGMRRLLSVWSNFHIHQVYGATLRELVAQSSRFAWQVLFGKRGKNVSLLDNAPLRELLRQVIPFTRLQELINDDVLDALCVTCSSYNDSASYSFFQGKPEFKEWQRHRRLGVRDNIHLSHLMASSAIPMVFPAEEIEHQYYGDGSVGFMSPISPAIHLGAEKILIIGLDPHPERPTYYCFDREQPPSIADIAGHVLDTVFIDSLDSDLERLTRVNNTLNSIPDELLNKVDLDLKALDTLVIAPSEDIGEAAADYVDNLPRFTRFFFDRLGVTSQKSSNILSYLLFEEGYTQHLIELGYQDAINQQEAILNFFSHLFEEDTGLTEEGIKPAHES